MWGSSGMEADPRPKGGKRKRILRIVVKVIVAVIVVALLASAIANHLGAKAVEKELDLLRSAGMPTTVDEAFLRTIPEDRNAAATYDRAFARITKESQEELARCVPKDPTADVTEALPVLKRIVGESAAIVALLREAETFPECHWNVTIRPPAAQTYFEATAPIFRGVRASVRLLQAGACVALAEGDSERALDDFKVAAALARSLDTQNTLIAKLVQMVMQDQALWILDRMLSTVNVSEDDARRMSQVLSRMAESTEMSQTMQGELVFGRACERDIRRPWMIIGTAHLRRAEAHRLGYMRFVIESAAKSPWEALDLLEERHRKEYSKPLGKGSFDKMWARMLSPAVIGAFEQNAGVLAKIEVRRAALTHLVGDHPEALDPFTGEPLFFEETETGFKFWSVGKDRVDNNGSAPPERKTTGHSDEGYDIVCEYPPPDRR